MVGMMAATEKFPTLLLNTSEGLLLQVDYDPLYFDWRAILRIPPSEEGTPGKEVMRVRSDDTPRFIVHDDDDPTDVAVFIGNAMFSVPKSESKRLRASILGMQEDAA